MNVCIVQEKLAGASETFIRAHAERLPADVTVVYGKTPHVNERPVLSQRLPARAFRKVRRMIMRRPWEWERTESYMSAFRKQRPDVVLAEYGTTGVAVLAACRRMRVPLVVHFHGFDATHRDVLEKFRDAYRSLFGYADAVIAVSRRMERDLAALGVPLEKIHYVPCGVDCRAFRGATPASAPPLFVAVGRFTDKKAPHLTILAFAQVLRMFPDARLRMIGTGPLYGACTDLAAALKLQSAVTFLGVQPPAVVQEEMRNARCFVQHSLQAAATGDCEGTPVAVLEAAATGLPVVATKHAGIPDVVLNEETGLLVNERDIEGMAASMCRLLENSGLATRLGQAAQERIREHFSMEQSIERLWSVLASSGSHCATPRVARSGS